MDELMDEWVDVADAPAPAQSPPAPELPASSLAVWPAASPSPPPPPSRPHDWRWYVGGLGRILIALGVLLLGFVAYQLWGTAIQHDRSQQDLQKQFSTQLSSTVPVATTTVTAPPTSTTPTAAPPTTTPATAPPTTTPAASTPPRPAFKNGDPVARLEIDRIRLDEIVVAGVGVDDLKKGPGYYPQTPLPGEPGNAAVAGHRVTYGAPFLDVDKLQPGDEIVATTYAGRFVYRVSGTQVVSPSDVSVLAGTPDNRLTLTSCDPKYSAKNRIIVTAAFDPAASSPIFAPPAVTVPPPTVSPPDTSQDNPVVTTTAPVVTTAPSFVTIDDSFQRGWFDDPAAWPQVFAWGLGCLAVVLGARWLGRRTRRWVGVLAAVVPFLVLLYFFYENASRLLPPNI